MSKLTVGFGVVLIVIGIAGFVVTGAKAPTALIPAGFGILVVIAGTLANDEAKRKHAIHAALGLALLCLFGTIDGVFKIPALLAGMKVERPGAQIEKTITALVCLAYLIVGIQSFIKARRK